METVSVVIPVYNSEKYLEKCIRSVLRQSYPALDIIAVDDGSTDHSGELLDRLALEDERLRVIHQKNKGVSAARNLGIRMAEGLYLLFVDGDDYIGRDYIRTLVDYAEKNRAEMVICGLTMVDENGKKIKSIVPGSYVSGQKEEWVFRIAAVCSHLYRLELWKKYGVVFSEGVRGEDMPISLFFAAICDIIVTVPAAEYYYVQHRTSAMHNFRGLKHYDLPYGAIEETIQKVQEVGIRNSENYFELFVLRILATCFFDLGRGASRDKREELSRYIMHILGTYFPDYDKNPLISLFSAVQVPFAQKAAVRILVILAKTNWIYPISRLLGH